MDDLAIEKISSMTVKEILSALGPSVRLPSLVWRSKPDLIAAVFNRDMEAQSQIREAVLRKLGDRVCLREATRQQ